MGRKRIHVYYFGKILTVDIAGKKDTSEKSLEKCSLLFLGGNGQKDPQQNKLLFMLFTSW